MKHFIITLLSALALSLSGLAFAGGAVVEAPEVETNPAVQQAPIEEVIEATECDPATSECGTEETADVIEATECDSATSECGTEETADVTETEEEIVTAS